MISARRIAVTLSVLGIYGLAGQPVNVFAGELIQPEQEASITGEATINNHVVGFEVRLGAGYLKGESTELVYEPDGSKMSELIWTLDDIYMFNIGASLHPLKWLKLNADLWTSINDGNSTMDDYDWFVKGGDWTHWSHHEDTALDKGYIFDINAELPFYSSGASTFSAFIGYKQDNWKWEAYGGSYVYSRYDFRDTVGTFPAGELGITYEQWWNVPYIGLGYSAEVGLWSFNSRIIGSTLAQPKAEDHHHMRDLLFEDNFDEVSMVAIDLAAGYNFMPNWVFTVAFHYQKYSNTAKEGSYTTITDLLTGEQFVSGPEEGPPGAGHKATLCSLNLRYTF